MKLAILGGSFNPVHIGHLALAEAALSGSGYDRIIIIPAFQSPLKNKSQGAGVQDRLDMILASIPAEPRFGIDDCEIRREGVSYTIDTIDYIEKLYRPEGKLGLILGDDLISGFSQWKKADELAKRLDLIIAGRVNFQIPSFPYPHLALDNDLLEVSSGGIRDRIQQKRSWQYLVPAGAAAIIRDRGLYGYERPAAQVDASGMTESAPCMAAPYMAAASARGEKITVSLTVRVEEEVRRFTSPRRFLHCRNTALLAWDLCRIYGLDSQKGYLAGISHDICKPFDDDVLMKLARLDGGPITSLERRKPSLLHGRAGAVFLKDRFNILDWEILEAVRLHTFGSDHLGKLAKVVYIADKLEPGRENVSPELKKIPVDIGLDRLFNEVIGDTVAYLRSRDLVISRDTLSAIKDMNDEKRES